jgi:hypothetical protein
MGGPAVCDFRQSPVLLPPNPITVRFLTISFQQFLPKKGEENPFHPEPRFSKGSPAVNRYH